MKPIVALFLVLASCASFSRKSPLDSLCSSDPSCTQKVLHAEAEIFETPEEAARFGLTFLLHEYPTRKGIGFVYPHPHQQGFIVLTGVGVDEKRVDHVMGGKAVAWFVTKNTGTSGSCSRWDRANIDRVNKHLNRDVPLYTQHSWHRKMKRCYSRREIK